MSTLILRSLAVNAVASITRNSSYRRPLKFVSRHVTITSIENLDTSTKKKEISKAMKAYMERASEHDTFMKQQDHEYKIGKRHLANIMGEDPETFTQEDVDRAIEYLFPSGIYSPAARPMMKPPEKVFPSKKVAEFNDAGRPHHFLFYTTSYNFFRTLYDISEQLQELQRFEDQQIRKNLSPDPNKEMDLITSEWIDKVDLEAKCVEKLLDKEYDSFILALNRLLSNPYSYRVKDFIFKFRKHKLSQQSSFEIPQPLIGEDGRKYVTIYECLRKRCRGVVTVRSPGTGKLSINGKDITFFEDMQSREQVLFPLIFCGLLNQVDVECSVENGGPQSQSGAIRWGISMALRSFVQPEMIEHLRIAGLLEIDRRRKERKKVCQPGARKKHTWKKR